MKLANLALPTAAVLSLLAGAAFQGSHKAQESYPQRVFANAKSDDFIGDKACAECHSDVSEHFHQSGHSTFSEDPSLPQGKLGCEGCHGPGKAHAAEQRGETPEDAPAPIDPTIIGYAKLTGQQASAACLRCHGDVMTQAHWHKTAHGQADVSCVSCHQIHPASQDFSAPVGGRGLVLKQVFPAARPATALLKADEATLCGTCHAGEVAKFRLQSRHPVPEGRMVCSDCHDIHPAKAKSDTKGGHQTVGSLREGMPKHVGMVKQSCVTCHGDKAGPFAFEHDPVAGWTGNGCVECHNPHGSQNPRLLKAFSRGLCAQCHTDKGANHFPGRTCWNAGCHVAIHGSNTDPRFFNR